MKIDHDTGDEDREPVINGRDDFDVFVLVDSLAVREPIWRMLPNASKLIEQVLVELLGEPPAGPIDWDAWTR
jgi:hypothetical protein